MTPPSITPGEVIAELEEALVIVEASLSGFKYDPRRYPSLHNARETCRAALSRARAYRDQHTTNEGV